MALWTRLREAIADKRGAVAVETALIAPVLVVMSIGGFQTSMIVTRQAELQSAAAEGAAIALANKPDNAEKRGRLDEVLQNSVEPNAEADARQVVVSVDPYYRCGSNTALVRDSDTTLAAAADACGTSKLSRYVRIRIVQTYTPIWRKYGIGSTLRYGVTRYVMYTQVS